jgi:hypothetical protein
MTSAAQQSHLFGRAARVRLLRCARQDNRFMQSTRQLVRSCKSGRPLTPHVA